MRTKPDPELRYLLAAVQLEGVVESLKGKLTESLHIDSYGNESQKITIEYRL